jgi:hypothetical protein
LELLIEVADALFISPATVKTHVSHLFTKLHARDRAQLVMLAYEAGVVAPGVPGRGRDDDDSPGRPRPPA